VLSEGEYPTKYNGVYLRPAETRKIFDERGWKNVAALQLRNPMHRSHEFLCKIAVEVCDACVSSHVPDRQPEAGHIPAEVRVECTTPWSSTTSSEKHVVQAANRLDMLYAGPREALLHATFVKLRRQQEDIGRDHAGVGDFYGIFEAQEIFDRIPLQGAAARSRQGPTVRAAEDRLDLLLLQVRRHGSLRTCPHTKEDRVSGRHQAQYALRGRRIP
jgi:sulfate adenylyltransferase